MEPNARLSAALRQKAPAKPVKAPPQRKSIAQPVKCISLFPADLQRIEEIRDTLRAHGRTISASHAIRLALRAVAIDLTPLAPLLEAMQKEDGRTLRHTDASPVK